MNCSCTKKAQGDEPLLTVAEVPERQQNSENPFGLSDEAYSQLVQATLVSTGNTYRLKKALEKLRSGQTVYIAALGGSVTEGAGPKEFTNGYAYKFNRLVRAKYTPDNGAAVHFNGAGLSGTPSLLGLVRYQSDVVEVLGHTPDILIIEFAVNDDAESANARAFEALVRDTLLENDQTAVIALYSAALYKNTMAVKKPIADYYQIPQVNMLETVEKAVASGLFKETDYYTDNVHPTEDGHNLMADSLMRLLAEVDSAMQEAPAPVPQEAFKDKPLSDQIRIYDDTDGVKITRGGFSGKDSATQTLKKTNAGDFPQNWYKPSNSSSEPFSLELSCRSLILAYKVQGSWMPEKFGRAEVYVDNKLVLTCDGNAENGWNNSEARLIIDGQTAESHIVEVKMAPGDEDKGFTILAMSYSK